MNIFTKWFEHFKVNVCILILILTLFLNLFFLQWKFFSTRIWWYNCDRGIIDDLFEVRESESYLSAKLSPHWFIPLCTGKDGHVFCNALLFLLTIMSVCLLNIHPPLALRHLAQKDSLANCLGKYRLS